MDLKTKLYLENIHKELGEDRSIIFKKSSGNLDYIIPKIMYFLKEEEKLKSRRKREKIRKKCIEYAKKEIDDFYDSLTPSIKVALFHALLKALDDTCNLFNISSDLYIKIAKEKEKTVEEVLEDVSRSIENNNKYFNIEIYEKELKFELLKIDKRVSSFLNSKIYENDSLINVELLNKALKNIRKNVDIKKDDEKFKYFKDETLAISEIYITITICRKLVKDAKTLDKKDKRNYRYNITRLENFVKRIEKRIIAINIFLKLQDHGELIEQAFKQNKELPDFDSLINYRNYLKYLDRKGRVETEYEILGVERK